MWYLVAILVVLVILIASKSEHYVRQLQGPYLMQTYLKRPAEHSSNFASALVKQSAEEPPVFPAVPGVEAGVRMELSKRMERMTSSKNNTEDPLVYALHGHSVLEAL